jgi:1,4-dihydroxy-2-naphthoate polyprenyltransferase
MNIPKILKIIRIHIVVGGFLAFLLGALLGISGGGRFNPTLFGLGYLVVLLGDLSSHYSNDYFDVEVDKFIEQKKFFSGSTILVNNPDLRSLSRYISISLLVCSNFLAFIIFVLGMPIEFLTVFLIASLVGWFYSAPPIRFVSRGFGEFAVACVTGFAIPGLGYLATRGHFDTLFLYFAIPFIMYGLMLSLSLQVSDIEVDRKGNKKTLAVRLGQRHVFSIILAMAFSSTLLFWIYAWKEIVSFTNFDAVITFSIFPLITSLVGFAGILEKKKANLLSSLIIASLFVFNLLMILYLMAVWVLW